LISAESSCAWRHTVSSFSSIADNSSGVRWGTAHEDTLNRYPAKLSRARGIIDLSMKTRQQNEPVRLVCPKCRSRLDVLETASGGRTVSVMGLGDAVSSEAKALELFIGPDAGPDIRCPACDNRFDPASPFRAVPLSPRR
jgi:hypothetical protein